MIRLLESVAKPYFNLDRSQGSTPLRSRFRSALRSAFALVALTAKHATIISETRGSTQDSPSNDPGAAGRFRTRRPSARGAGWDQRRGEWIHLPDRPRPALRARTRRTRATRAPHRDSASHRSCAAWQGSWPRSDGSTGTRRRTPDRFLLRHMVRTSATSAPASADNGVDSGGERVSFATCAGASDRRRAPDATKEYWHYESSREAHLDAPTPRA
jgi:hypothetical protein